MTGALFGTPSLKADNSKPTSVEETPVTSNTSLSATSSPLPHHALSPLISEHTLSL